MTTTAPSADSAPPCFPSIDDGIARTGRRVWRPSLRQRLLALVVCIVVPLVALGVYGAWQTYRAEQTRAETALLDQAVVLSLHLDSEFERAETSLHILGASATLANGDLDAFNAALRAAGGQFQNTNFALNSPDGHIVLNTRWQPGERHADARSSAFVAQVFQSGRAVITDLIRSEATGELGTAVAVPVFLPSAAGAGQAAGRTPAYVLTATLSRQHLAELLASLRVPVEGWVAGIADRSGVLVARSRLDTQLAGMQIAPGLVQHLQSLASGIIPNYVTREGQPSVIAFAHARRSGYSIILAQPAASFEAPLWRALTNAVALGLLLLGIGIGAALLLYRRITAALHGLTAAQAGQAVHTGLPEVDQIGTTLARVAQERERDQAELRSAHDSLERLVADLGTAKSGLERTLAERNLLLREVYHRVKNNLQTVDALLTMQASRLEDPAARHALDDLRRRVHALGLVHQQLMSSGDLATFDVRPFLEQLLAHLAASNASAHPVKISVAADPMPVTLDFAIPLALLVTELVSNSYKHAFPDRGGTVSVALRRAEGDALLSVADDGRGVERGTAPAQPGLGTRIIRSLVRQLEGRMNVMHDRGTRTEILMPLPPL